MQLTTRLVFTVSVLALSAPTAIALPVVDTNQLLQVREPLPEDDISARSWNLKKVKKYGKAAAKIGHIAVDVAAANNVPGAGILSSVAGYAKQKLGWRRRAVDSSDAEELYSREADEQLEDLMARFLESEEGIKARALLGDELDARGLKSWLKKKGQQAKKALSKVTLDDVVTTASKIGEIASNGQAVRYHRRDLDLEQREVQSLDELD